MNGDKAQSPSRSEAASGDEMRASYQWQRTRLVPLKRERRDGNHRPLNSDIARRK